MGADNRFDVFLSYNSRDHVPVEVVARWLRDQVELDNGAAIPSETLLLWTAGVKPSHMLEPLRYQKLKGRLRTQILRLRCLVALRTVYLMKLPRVTKKLRVLASWMLDLLFGTEIEQLVTLRDVDAVTQWLERIRARDERRVASA
jgi:hypothetical protein